MANEFLPENPDFDQLRSRARELQRAEQIPLHEAQLTVARRYGFPSWARLKRQVEAIEARSWNYAVEPDDTSLTDAFVRAACLNYSRDSVARIAEAGDLLAAHPELSSGSLAAAVICADVEAARGFIEVDPAAATRAGGPYAWSPLLYLAYGRVATTAEATLACARMLLDAGADPNDGRFFGGFAIPFTVITGIFGGGEQSQAPHRHAMVLARLLLERRAEPNDGQTLYNRMFEPADDAFALLFECGLGQGDGGVWHRLIPDLLKPPAGMVADLLTWAVTHDQRERVALLVRHGVDILRPSHDGKTPLHLALINGYAELAGELRACGAEEPTLTGVQRFIASALAGDGPAVAAMSPAVVAAAKVKRPALVVWAASQNRVEAVTLLVASGFGVNALGRGDIPVEQEWQTALHTAVDRDNLVMAERLLQLGADPTIRDKRFDGTPLDWAEHLGRPEMVEFLSRL